MVQVKQCIFSPTQIAAMYAAPIIALPAPPLGFVNNILGISHNMTFVSAAYITATKILYGSNDGTSLFEDSLILPSVVDYNLPALKSNATQSVFSTTEDFYVTTDAAAATGDSTINAYIIFEQVQIGS